MKKPLLLILALVVVVGGSFWYVTRTAEAPTEQNAIHSTNSTGSSQAGSGQASTPEENENNGIVDETQETVSIVASNLEIPWDIAFLPDETMLVTERPGRLVHIESGLPARLRGQAQAGNVIEVNGVAHTGEGGLLGIALHPDFEENRYVYLYQTTRIEDGSLRNFVVRYTYEDNELTQDRVIVSDIAGAPYHDGGRIEFGPDGYLWITTGDATVEANAQNPQTRAGSILRLNPDGSVPADSPYPNGVYSYGHRNPQGLAWDSDGRLWSTEHGRSGLRSGMDEVNLIQAGANYGWPEIEGDETQPGMVTPAAHSGPDVTWAPASAAYYDNSIFFGGLRGAAVYEAVLNGTEVSDVRRYFYQDFGRIRTIRLGPDGDPSTSSGQAFYLTTSNRDGRGNPESSDDRIIRIDPQLFRR